MRRMDTATEILINNRMVMVLLILEKESVSITKLRKKADLSYVSVRKNMRLLEKKGILKSFVSGREVRFGLTDKGEELMRAFKKVKRILDET